MEAGRGEERGAVGGQGTLPNVWRLLHLKRCRRCSLKYNGMSLSSTRARIYLHDLNNIEIKTLLEVERVKGRTCSESAGHDREEEAKCACAM